MIHNLVPRHFLQDQKPNAPLFCLCALCIIFLFFLGQILKNSACLALRWGECRPPVVWDQSDEQTQKETQCVHMFSKTISMITIQNSALNSNALDTSKWKHILEVAFRNKFPPLHSNGCPLCVSCLQSAPRHINFLFSMTGSSYSAEDKS